MIAAVFPGQGSQKPGMGRDLAESFPESSAVFDEVANATGVDVRRLCWEADEDTLRDTRNAQLALFTCGVAAWEAFNCRSGLKASAVAGHSVGEYAALVAAGVLAVDDGARLVQVRGDLMAGAGDKVPGTMAAVLGLDRDQLQQACEAAGGQVVIANDNCPGQLVISGERDAVERASRLASEGGAKRVIPLNVSGAFHSPLMAEPARAMATALAAAEPRDARLKVYSNVTSEPASEGFLWPSLLEQQLLNPVRWTESVQHMIRDGITVFVECGGGDVLSGLIRRTEKSVTTLRVADSESLQATLEALAT